MPALFAALIIIAAACVFFFIVPAQVEAQLNRIAQQSPYTVSDGAGRLHARLFIADMHADSLLWNKDLLIKNSRGHVDFPRLVESNTALQFFTIVTKTPRGLNIESNADDTDNITLLSIAQRQPVRTWTNLKERAKFQIEKLEDFAARSNNQLVVIKTADDLQNFIARRQIEPRIVATVIGIEGAHCLEGDLTNLEMFVNKGVRMIAPTHFFDNEIGGSAHGTEKKGLTDLGKQMIVEMERRGITLDLAHASSKTIDDALAISTKPVVVSHTGVRGTCDNTRNLSDDQLRRIAATGGVIGIGFWETAVCGTDAKAIARAIRYTANLVGVNHVALGSDFDGAVVTPFDVTGNTQITEALLAEGFNETEIAAIMGGNVVRVLSQNLP